MIFACCDGAGYRDLKPARVPGPKEECDGFRRHPLRNLIIVSNKNCFRVIDAQMDAAGQSMAAAFQLPQPLKGHLEIGDNGHAKHATARRRQIF